jgi:hypothetical protein
MLFGDIFELPTGGAAVYVESAKVYYRQGEHATVNQIELYRHMTEVHALEFFPKKSGKAQFGRLLIIHSSALPIGHLTPAQIEMIAL